MNISAAVKMSSHAFLDRCFSASSLVSNSFPFTSAPHVVITHLLFLLRISTNGPFSDTFLSSISTSHEAKSLSGMLFLLTTRQAVSDSTLLPVLFLSLLTRNGTTVRSSRGLLAFSASGRMSRSFSTRLWLSERWMSGCEPSSKIRRLWQSPSTKCRLSSSKPLWMN